MVMSSANAGATPSPSVSAANEKGSSDFILFFRRFGPSVPFLTD
jgi:hypothetical protein